jgi:hypothetical protein
MGASESNLGGISNAAQALAFKPFSYHDESFWPMVIN